MSPGAASSGPFEFFSPAIFFAFSINIDRDVAVILYGRYYFQGEKMYFEWKKNFSFFGRGDSTLFPGNAGGILITL